MLKFLIGFGMPSWAARLLMFVLVPLLAVLLLLWALDAYGDRRYRAGRKDADAAWVAAGEKLKQQAAASGKAADNAAAKRTEDFVAKQAAEKEKLDEAQRDGSSPFDVLFGNSGVR